MAHTLCHSFVLFLARAIACPSLTNTQPTGTSSASNACSAYFGQRGIRFEAYHDESFPHPCQIFRILLFWWYIHLPVQRWAGLYEGQVYSLLALYLALAHVQSQTSRTTSTHDNFGSTYPILCFTAELYVC